MEEIREIEWPPGTRHAHRDQISALVEKIARTGNFALLPDLVELSLKAERSRVPGFVWGHD